MGFSFQRSLRFGPLRVNLSGSGVGLSVGVRGARVNFGPRGTYVSLGRGGFRYRQKLSNTRSSPAGAPSPSPHAPELPAGAAPPVAGFIPTSSVDALRDAVPDEVLLELQRRTALFNWFAAYLPSAAVVVIIIGAVFGLVPCIVAAVVLGAGAIPIYRWNEERRSARLIYDVDDPALVERLAQACTVGQALATSRAVWHVWAEEATSDRKHHAGASTLNRRTLVHLTPGIVKRIESNIEPWSIPVGPQQLTFLPDRLLIAQGNSFSGLPYSRINASVSPVRFIEEGPLPDDAALVGQTWRYVNKSGGPDKRFANNRQLPILKYSELELVSDVGVRILLQVSNEEAARRACTALNELSRIEWEHVRVSAAT